MTADITLTHHMIDGEVKASASDDMREFLEHFPLEVKYTDEKKLSIFYAGSDYETAMKYCFEAREIIRKYELQLTVELVHWSTRAAQFYKIEITHRFW